MKRNPLDLFKSILEFYDIALPDSYIRRKTIKPKLGKMHYRKGSLNEWREVFTQEQIEKASNVIPESLFEEFGWER